MWKKIEGAVEPIVKTRKVSLYKVKELYLKTCRVFNEEGLYILIKKIAQFPFRKSKDKNHSINQSEDVCIKDYLKGKFPFLSSFPIDHEPLSSLRVNLLLPSMGAGKFWGGVATATIFGAYLANQLKASLRFIITDIYADFNYEKVQSLFRLPPLKKVEHFDFSFDFCALSRKKISVSENDVFIATMWHTSYLARELSKYRKFIYFIQDYEPIFYPNGDDKLLAKESYLFNDYIPIFNTKNLLGYFSDKFKREYDCKLAFEPAFPKHLYKMKEKKKTKGQKKLLFYSRPNVASRNLFFRGLHLIDKAIDNGILAPQEWVIFFVGEEVPNFKFSSDIMIKRMSKMPWANYCEFVSEMDLAIALMDSPHPSYPPIEFAASGVVVLTNKADGKEDLHYSKNMIIAKPDLNSLLEGLRVAIDLVNDPIKKMKNYGENKILSDWGEAFKNPIEKVKEVLNL